MQSIVRLKWDNKLTIQESMEIVEHNDSYDIKLETTTGSIETDYYINKDLYNNIPFEHMATWENRLYVSGIKYHENPDHWINLVKTWRRENDLRKWLK